MAITFFDTRIGLALQEDDDHKLMLRKFQLVKAQVMSPPTEVAFPLSWFVGAEHVMTPLLQNQLEFRSAENTRQKNSGFEVPESRLSTGVGFSTVEFWNTYGFVLGGLDVGYLWSDHTVDLDGSPIRTPRELRNRFMLAPTGRVGFSTRLARTTRLTTEAHIRALTQQKGILDTGALVQLSAFVSKDTEMKAGMAVLGLENGGIVSANTGITMFF